MIQAGIIHNRRVWYVFFDSGESVEGSARGYYTWQDFTMWDHTFHGEGEGWRWWRLGFGRGRISS